MGTTVLSQQINCIGLWLQIFVHFNTSAQTDSALLFALVTMVTLFLYLATILWSQRNSGKFLIKSFFLFDYNFIFQCLAN